MSRPPTARVRRLVEHAGLIALLGGRALVGLVWPPLRVRATVYQVYVQGVCALGLAVAASAFTGMALALQFGAGLQRFGAASVLPQLTTLGLTRELVPVMLGLVIGARLGAGIAAELGTMSVTEQLDALRVLGADPVRELVVPRVFAATVVLAAITVLGDAVAVAGAMMVAKLEHNIGARYFLDAAREAILAEDFVSGVLKAGMFGGTIALVGCWHGGRARGGADGVGRATTQTVVQGALAVIVSDYFISRLLAPVLAKGPSF